MYDKMIAVTDRKLVNGDFLAQIEKVCSLSPKAVLLREKDLSPQEYAALAEEVLKICSNYNVPLIIHSFERAARKLNISRLHLPLPMLKQLENRSKWDMLGTSCHSIEQMQEAVSLGCTYIFLGNIFETQCKPGLAGKGIELLREVCSLCPVPIYAIGGISEKNLPQLIQAGAAGGCMMSGFMKI